MDDRPLVIGKGTFSEIRPGVYQYRHNLGKDPETGKYRYSPKRTIHTKRKSEVRAALESYKVELNTGVVVKTASKTVGEYARKFHELRAGTMGSELAYKREGLDIKHIGELLGNCRLQSLRPPMIKQAYADARKSGRFSENELNKVNTKLNQILKETVNDELIAKNPCEKISVPRPASAERQALSVEEASRLFECLNDEGMDAHIIGTLLLLDTGMRRGEMLGLAWGCFDAEKGTVFIAQQFANDKTLRAPKSKSSRRHISLSDGMVAALVRWKGLQAEYLGKIGKDQTDETPVVNSDLGDHMDPNNYSRWFRTFCVKHAFGTFSSYEEFTDTQGRKRTRRTGYKGLTPHMLRHTQATLLIGSATDIKTVQSRLGHSSVNLTLNTYSHAIAANDKKAANTFGDLIEGKRGSIIQ